MSFKSKHVAQIFGFIVVVGIISWSSFSASKVFSTPSSQEAEGAPAAPSVTILKPGESIDFVPSPVPDMKGPLLVQPVSPGQPVVGKPRPSQEEINRLAQEGRLKPLSDAPFVNHVELDIHPVEIKTVTMNSNSIVIARVSKVYPSKWTTDDGSRPKYLHHENGSYYIYTLTDVIVEQTIQGDVKPGDTLTLVKNGGRVGEDIFDFDDSYPNRQLK